MHIAEGFLPPVHAAVWYAAAAPFVIHGAMAVVKRVRQDPDSKLLLAAAGAFTFALSAVKLPSVTGSSSHPTGTGAGAVLFKDPDINTTGAQVLFSTHDTSLLGNAPNKILDPGEIWFCEKRGAASDVFPLADFDTRASNNEQKRYLTGRFGALPDVDFSRITAALDLARRPA